METRDVKLVKGTVLVSSSYMYWIQIFLAYIRKAFSVCLTSYLFLFFYKPQGKSE